ncbi:activator of stress genes 1 [Fusarium beomiforme]|uniref:Activator of stress genes 1 n=1 Tax=Fusarium beomiforme TaxID=44412 RepID=A0A9P5DRM5_9HYPO|nr:activator of stress genes 1 [Fusarium beomiforme]
MIQTLFATLTSSGSVKCISWAITPQQLRDQTGPATLDWPITISGESKADPAVEGVDARSLQVYKNKKGRERVIPFHWECYEILALYLTGSFKTTKIDKGALYRAFDRFSVTRDFWRQAASPEYRCLSLDYGDANEAQKDDWKSIPGKEYTVVNPTYQRRLKEEIIDYISAPNFDKSLQSRHVTDLELNPGTALPETVIFGVSEFLDTQNLIKLFVASSATFSSLRDNGSFWKRRMKTHLPYFVELHECLREQSRTLKDRDFRKIFLWAEAASRPHSDVARLMFPLANRRRIWKVCEQIEKLYDKEPRQKDAPTGYIRYQAVRSETQILGDTREPALGLLTFSGTRRAISQVLLLALETIRGFLGTKHGKKTTGYFSGGVWIKGFIFHIYASSSLRDRQTRSWNYSSCKGVTVHMTDGSEYTYGQDGQNLFKLPFSAADNMTIIGIKGTLTAHKRSDVYPFIEKMRFLQAPTNGGQRPLEAPKLKVHEIITNQGRSVLWGVDMKSDENEVETDEPADLVPSMRNPTHLRAGEGFSIVGIVMGCGKVHGRWHSDEYYHQRNKARDWRRFWGRLNMWDEDHMDQEDVRGPWTKEQYDRRNESTVHTGMSKFGIITKSITGEQEQSI